MQTELFFPFPLNLSNRFQVNQQHPKFNRWETTENNYVFTTLAAGLSENDVVVEAQSNKLSLKMNEFNALGLSSRHQQWSLPDDADLGNVDASLSRGILTITVGKTQEARPQKVAVKNLDRLILETDDSTS